MPDDPIDAISNGKRRTGPAGKSRTYVWAPGEAPRRAFWQRPVLIGLPLLLLAFAGVSYGLAVMLRPAPEAAAVLQPDPLAALPPGLRDTLTRPETEMPAKMTLVFSGQPQALCDQLDAIGLKNNGWRRAPFHQDRYQCASETLALTSPGRGYGPATLFFLLRGPDQNSIDYLRLKLVVEGLEQVKAGQEAVRLVIGELSDRYGWAVPETFLAAVDAFKPLEVTDRGVRLVSQPEDPDLTGDPKASQRLNIVIDFSEPELIRPAERFKPEPWQKPKPNG
ncbi:DUF6030 family protein [Roseibium sp. RKSG952]|uniref:DUF6030 family protein n=1 Tax=Roseibium sp. RKSG952 TaxID=2529384 RepID=UPI0012BD3278|nr:DUF6030 family protein [Roseibium sp. RKSG952]MTH96770.1 hypothetical protein [Roseibium sp. RKSG952]